MSYVSRLVGLISFTNSVKNPLRWLITPLRSKIFSESFGTDLSKMARTQSGSSVIALSLRMYVTIHFDYGFTKCNLPQLSLVTP